MDVVICNESIPYCVCRKYTSADHTYIYQLEGRPLDSFTVSFIKYYYKNVALPPLILIIEGV